MRAQGLEAAHGATDFGEYFVYFSFFLMVSALLLTGLFFKLGVEQRMREIGVLRALGFSMAKIRAMFLLEGAVLAAAGAVVGLAGGAGVWRAHPVRAAHLVDRRGRHPAALAASLRLHRWPSGQRPEW